ncbi:MAG: hypothetical protein ACRD19_08370 [Terriglobia bacterium]
MKLVHVVDPLAEDQFAFDRALYMALYAIYRWRAWLARRAIARMSMNGDRPCHRTPPGRETTIKTLSQGFAMLHPGLFSCLPSGKAAVGLFPTRDKDHAWQQKPFIRAHWAMPKFSLDIRQIPV